MVKQTDEFSFRLKASTIHGVGVFANHDIDAGTRLDLFEDGTRFLPASPSGAAKRLLDVLSVSGENGIGYYCPPSFKTAAVGWYLNHSDHPNAGHVDWEYFALRHIADGEEITIDYRTLGEKPGEHEPLGF